ncbi:cerebellin-1-like [Littorina saxatilis]|uniref:C1q domain-containing protein n=1 Tax=Littorina saxatilis TaxID=31220 RepID=A0AAN9BUW9_9CAEN
MRQRVTRAVPKMTLEVLLVLSLVNLATSTREKRADDLSATQAEMAGLANELNQLRAQVVALTNTLTSQGQQIDHINAARAQRVAFAAYISHEPHLTASAGVTVLFNGVITNVGSAFNPATSAFTAPFNGQYMFFVRVDISKDCFGVDLRLNGKRVAAANNDGYVSSHVNAGVALNLKVGDVVTVTFYSSQGVVDAGIESVFTGFLLA